MDSVQGGNKWESLEEAWKSTGDCSCYLNNAIRRM